MPTFWLSVDWVFSEAGVSCDNGDSVPEVVVAWGAGAPEPIPRREA